MQQGAAPFKFDIAPLIQYTSAQTTRRPAVKTLPALLAALLLTPLLGVGATRFYNYYSEGLRFMEQKDWMRAVEEFKSAASLEFEDAGRKRTYGTRFIEYFPHREMGIAHYYLGEFEIARKELELSLAYEDDERTSEYLQLVRRGVSPEEYAARIENKPDEQEESVDPVVPVPKPKAEVATRSDILPVGALTYDPSRVTQVGSRLALAVMPFVGKGEAKDLAEPMTEEMIAQLVTLRRFKVIERSALDKVLEEQSLQASGLVDDKTATNLGKLAGADAIVVGSLNIAKNRTKVSARVIDTETGETIVAKAEGSEGVSFADAEAVTQQVAIKIYNELPLVEGFIVKSEPSLFYIDIGNEKGIRKGSKCVAFREGEEIKHPVTGEVLGKKVTKLGELIVVAVYEKMAAVRVAEKEGDIVVGDKVVVK
ncbi:MAG: Tetratricopeptide repeat-containing protein [Bacteroidetes bacterium]|nr:Tetratricopeptide repeat-containing protein [Bacteroidota bacterium]